MARNLLMGYYYCNSGHSHSSFDEVSQCNRIVEEKNQKDHELRIQNLRNESRERSEEHRRMAMEEEKLKLERQRIDQERMRERREHELKMEAMKLERMRLYNSKWAS